MAEHAFGLNNLVLATSMVTMVAATSTAVVAQPRTDLQQLATENASNRGVVEAEQRQVERFYSTKPRKVILDDRKYLIPANYFGPKQLDDSDAVLVPDDGFGFSLFLPDYGGCTTRNWQNPFDHRRIEIVRVATVNRNEMIPQRDGTYRLIAPSAYGDPSARFANRRSRLEDSPSLHVYGLEGYRRRGPSPETVWTAKRQNGEFFFLECSVPPVELGHSRVVNPTCEAQYYSASEDLDIVYRYSQYNLPKWREIDDAIWNKLHEWEVQHARGK